MALNSASIPSQPTCHLQTHSIVITTCNTSSCTHHWRALVAAFLATSSRRTPSSSKAATCTAADSGCVISANTSSLCEALNKSAAPTAPGAEWTMEGAPCGTSKMQQQCENFCVCNVKSVLYLWVSNYAVVFPANWRLQLIEPDLSKRPLLGNKLSSGLHSHSNYCQETTHHGSCFHNCHAKSIIRAGMNV